MRINPNDLDFGYNPPFDTSIIGRFGLDLEKHLKIDWLEANVQKTTESYTSNGQCAGTLLITPPSGFPCMYPLAVSMTVRDEYDSNVPRMVRITSVMIEGMFQELINTPAPTAATTQFIESSLWDPLEIGAARPILEGDRARPVVWDFFSCHAYGSPLQIVWFDPNPAGLVSRVKLDVYGVPLSTRPQPKVQNLYGAGLHYPMPRSSRPKPTPPPLLFQPPLTPVPLAKPPMPPAPEGMEWSEQHGRLVPKINAPDPKERILTEPPPGYKP